MYSDKIILIGSGPSVLGQKKGEIIDSFNDVVRFNDYEISLYEEFVGSKTTIWARSNSNRITERDCSVFDTVIIANPPKDFATETNYKTALLLHEEISNSVMIDESIKNDMQKFLKLCGDSRSVNYKKNLSISRRVGWPSSGLMVIAHCIERYKNPVYIYGFDNFELVGGHPRHYYNDTEKMKTSCMHNGKKEKEWINKKISERKIIIL